MCHNSALSLRLNDNYSLESAELISIVKFQKNAYLCFDFPACSLWMTGFATGRLLLLWFNSLY